MASSSDSSPCDKNATDLKLVTGGLHRTVRCSQFTKELEVYSFQRINNLDAAASSDTVKAAIFELLGEVRGCVSSYDMPDAAVDIYYTNPLPPVASNDSVYNVSPDQPRNTCGFSVWSEHHFGSKARPNLVEEVKFNTGYEQADWLALFNRLFELNSKSTRRLDLMNASQSAGQQKQYRFVCLKMNASHVDAPYGLRPDSGVPDHYTIHPVEPVALTDFNSDAKGYGRGELIPNIGIVYDWAPCSLLLKSRAVENWRSYRPGNLGQMDENLNCVMLAFDHVADSIASIEDIDMIDELTKTIVQSFTVLEDLSQLTQDKLHYIAWTLEEFLSDCAKEEFSRVKEVKDAVHQLSDNGSGSLPVASAAK